MSSKAELANCEESVDKNGKKSGKYTTVRFL